MDEGQRDAELLALILELAAMIDRRLGPISREKFEDDHDEIDLTSFRLAHIGEASRKLSDALKARHPEIAWKGAYAMRNLISHDYVAIDPRLIWTTAKQEIAKLVDVCRQELDRLKS